MNDLVLNEIKYLKSNVCLYPSSEIHPLLNVKKPQEKTYSKRSKPQKSKSGKPEKSRHKDRSSRGGEEANENSSELLCMCERERDTCRTDRDGQIDVTERETHMQKTD